MATLIKGTNLPLSERRKTLNKFVHRFTGDNVPRWASNTNYPMQFKDDADWLENTYFWVKSDHTLDERFSHCISDPTWPNGKGVWGRKGKDW